MPEQRRRAAGPPCRQWLFAATREEVEVAAAVGRIALRRFRTRNFKQRRIQVHAVDRLVAAGGRRNFAGPTKDERDADAALVEHSFATLERHIVGDATTVDALALVAADATVVAGEDHERVVSEFQVVERREDAADVFVEAGDHAGIDRIGVSADRRLGLEVRGPVLAGLQRRMYGIEGQIEKKGLALVALDERDRLAAEGVGQILGLVDRLASCARSGPCRSTGCAPPRKP